MDWKRKGRRDAECSSVCVCVRVCVRACVSVCARLGASVTGALLQKAAKRPKGSEWWKLKVRGVTTPPGGDGCSGEACPKTAHRLTLPVPRLYITALNGESGGARSV